MSVFVSETTPTEIYAGRDTLSLHDALPISTLMFAQSLAHPRAHLTPFTSANKAMPQPLKTALGIKELISPSGPVPVKTGIKAGA